MSKLSTLLAGFLGLKMCSDVQDAPVHVRYAAVKPVAVSSSVVFGSFQLRALVLVVHYQAYRSNSTVNCESSMKPFELE